MLKSPDVVFLLDVDNTLLDNDRFAADLRARLQRDFGIDGNERYWTLYAQLRQQTGYADYLATLQLFRNGLEDDPDLLQMSAFMLEYPFAQRLYPRAREVVSHLGTLGVTAILSDGDVVFQPRKIQRSGLWDAVDGHVLIYLHKQTMLPAMQRRLPARHYVMIDDKPLILADMKRAMGSNLTTVFVRQGHYADEAAGMVIDPAPDRSIDRIGELCDHGLDWFVTAMPAASADD